MEWNEDANTIAVMAAIIYAIESHEIAVTELPTTAKPENAVKRAREIYEMVLRGK